jgi:hypothetical protein
MMDYGIRVGSEVSEAGTLANKPDPLESNSEWPHLHPSSWILHRGNGPLEKHEKFLKFSKQKTIPNGYLK